MLLVFLSFQILLWTQVRNLQPRWLNVPPPPKSHTASGVTLGDKQFAYRSYGVRLQNMGDYGGNVTPLRDLDYNLLGKWFDVLDSLDHKSNFLPMMVAYYFASTDDPNQLDPVIGFLRKVGIRDAHYYKKWRWLVSAIYYARHKQKDLDKALEMAYELAALNEQGVELPSWALNMPSFIKLEQGDKSAAFSMTIQILQESAEEMHPNEVNFMVDYLCNRILEGKEAASFELCQDR